MSATSPTESTGPPVVTAPLPVTSADDPDPDPPDDRGRRSWWTWLLLCIPALAAGLLLRVWMANSPLLALNADEAVTGLQGFDVLNGDFHVMVGGNSYGAATESFLVAPLLTFWSGAAPLRFTAFALAAVGGAALIWAARPLLGRTLALTVGLVSWVSSGTALVIWSTLYMGYSTGVIAMTMTLGCAARLMVRPSTWLAALGGFSAGFALWGHPVWGAVALLGLIAPTVRNARQLSYWVATALGGLVGVSGWLAFILRNGAPQSAAAPRESTYLERLWIFFDELLPRAFGLRSIGSKGTWIPGEIYGPLLAVVLIAGSLGGLLVLMRKVGAPAVPLVVAGFGAFPVLALFEPLVYFADGRYSLAFMPMLLIGLFSWLLLLPHPVRRSPWLPLAVPVVWAVLLCYPQIYTQVGLNWKNPDADTQQMTDLLTARGITALTGDYWSVYPIDFLSGNAFHSVPLSSIRLNSDVEPFLATPPDQVAYVYRGNQVESGQIAPPPGDLDDYERVSIGRWVAYLPR